MAGDSLETLGGMRFEAIIGRQKENVDSARGDQCCQPICSNAPARWVSYLLPFGTVTSTSFLAVFPDLSIAWTVIV